MMQKRSVCDIVVVKFIVVFQNLAFDWWSLNPAHVILHLAGHQQSRFSHHFRSHPHVPLFYERHWFFHGLCEFKTAQHHCQSSPAEGRDRKFLGNLNFVLGIDEPHPVKFIKKLLCSLDSERIVRRKLLEFADEGCDQTCHFVVVGVILPILQMVSVHNSSLSLVGLNLPVVEIDLFQ